MRSLLASSTDGYLGTGRGTPIKLGSISAKRGEIEDWLKWKAQRDAFWPKLGVIVAVFAAIFSLLALFQKG
jgi:hypothetical protein